MPDKEQSNLYRCPGCGAEFKRVSELKQIKSYCSKADKYVFMKRVKVSKAKDNYYQHLKIKQATGQSDGFADKYIKELEKKLKEADINIESLHNAIRRYL